jgi:hypothetical protein
MSKVLTNHILGAAGGLLWALGSITPVLAGDLAVEEKVKAIRNRYDEVERPKELQTGQTRRNG